MKLTHLTLASSIFSLAAAGGAIANGAPAGCCDKVTELEARVDRLDAKAVEGTTKNIQIYGHVNRAMMWADNGRRSNTAHVDNDNSSSRLGFHGQTMFNDDIKVGAVLEMGYTPNSTQRNNVHAAQTSAQAPQELNIRVADVYFKSKDFGTLTLGHGHMASDGTMEDTDLSGTRVAANGSSAAGRSAGGVVWLLPNNTASEIAVRNTFDSGDGLGRHDRIRFDTRSYYGFSMGASHGYQNSGDMFDVAAKFAGKFMGVKVAAQVSYAKDQTQDTNLRLAAVTDTAHSQINGSIGALLPFSVTGKDGTGVSLHFATSHRDWRSAGEPNGKVYFGKVGFQDYFTSLGKTAFAADFGHFRNVNIPSGFALGTKLKAKSYGLTAVQHIDKVATELYASYRHYTGKADAPGTGRINVKDIDTVTVGARVKF